MNRLNRRRFLALGAASTASVVLVACGNETPSEADLSPTQIPDVAGAPPTLAPITGTPSAEQGGGESGGDGGGAAGALTITTLDSMAFDPSEADVSPGQTITVQNDGFLQHDLAVDEWGGAMTPLLNNGDTAEFTIPDDAEIGATFTYYCTVAGHRPAGMEGTFTIVEAGAAAPAGEEEAPVAAEEDAPAGEEGAAAGGAGEPITIVTLDSMAFDPSEVDVSPGQTIIVQNDGFLQHDLAVDEWGGPMIELLTNGQSGEFTIPEDAAVGEQFVYYCTVAGHRPAGMEGTFTIVEGGGAAAPAAGAAEEAESPEAAEGTPAATAGDASDPTAVTVTATEWEFSPADFEVAPGGTITLVNEGTVAHAMTAEAFDGEFVRAGAGQSAEFTVPDDVQPGDTIEYTAVNSSASDLGMSGTITIVEGEGGAAAAAGEATPEAAASGAGASDLEPITIIALDTFDFDPSEVDVMPGQTVILQNDGFLQHDLAVDEWGGPMTELLNNGQTGEFTIPEDVAEGEQYVFYCTVAGHRQGGMEGTFTIVAGGGGGAAAPATGDEASPAASPAATPVASPAASAGAAGGGSSETIEVIATDIAFDQEEITIPADTDVTINLTNEGFVQHDLLVEDTEFGTALLDNGESEAIVVNLPAGQYIFYCSVAGHRQAGMEGTLIVE